MNRTTKLRLTCGSALLLLLTACRAGAPIGTIELGELVYSGDVDGDYLSRQLGQLDPPFNACYMRVKRRDHNVEGVIELALRGGGGRLVGEITSNSTGSEELGECVIGAISGLTIIERGEHAPWDYTADWSVTFELVRLNRGAN